MQGLPSAILGDQRELARLPEASVSNPIQAFSLSKGLSSLAASFPVYSRMRTGARRLSYHLVRFSGFSISSRKTIWNGKGCPRLHARRQSESVDGHQPHILNSSNATATGRDASDSLWPGKSPGGRLPHGLVDFEIIFSTPTVPAAADSPGDPIALPQSALSGMAVRTGILGCWSRVLRVVANDFSSLLLLQRAV